MSLKAMFDPKSGDTAVDTDRAVIVLELLDMSGSMSSNQQAVIDALARRRAALQPSEDAPALRMSMWTFNGQIGVLHDFQPLENVPVVDAQMYHPDGMTALYDTVREGFKAVKAFRDELRQKGVSTKTVIIVYTDGEDTASRNATAADVAKEAADLLREEATLVLFGFGIDVKTIAAQMGFPEKNALSLNNNERDIRHAIEVRTPNLLKQASS